MHILVDHGRSENFGDAAMVQGTLSALTKKYPTHTYALSSDGLTDCDVLSFPSVTEIPTYHMRPQWKDPFLHAQPTKGKRSTGAGHLWPMTRYSWTWPMVNIARKIQRVLYTRYWPSMDDLSELYIQSDGQCIPLLDWCNQFDAGLIPGGLITDEFTASLYRQCLLMHAFHKLRKPFYLYGVQCGPFTKTQLQKQATEAMQTATVCTVRSPDFPKDTGATFIHDMSMGIIPSPHTNEWLQKHKIQPGKFLTYHMRSSFYNSSMRRYIPYYASLLTQLSQTLHMPLVHVPISLKESDNDRHWGTDIAKYLSKVDHFEIEDVTLKDTALIKGIIGQSHGIIGVSYHACIFALSQGVPAINIHASKHYSHKAKGLVETFHDDRISLCIPECHIENAYAQCLSLFADAAFSEASYSEWNDMLVL
ncbi:hypothetical protein COU75_03050 [Candidatus Peregrinibacteria bacterium CG10_big_fil_rev_8_21_14_0_10_42_8]|nr:MAG: hypothetical protein COU75_03050 [Candidatus Peregrinibacteria bacterium CG10_big_fil_rev_8_21_14_0_10_42_8]